MTKNNSPLLLAIHGGAGGVANLQLSELQQQQYHFALQSSLKHGFEILINKGPSEIAVMEAIKELEDSSLFNAGKGSVLNEQRQVTMDASIMRGSDLQAGAIGHISMVKNPITLAYKLMLDPEKVMLVGDGALEYAKKMNLQLKNEDYFLTEHRLKQLLEIQEKKPHQMQLDHDTDLKTETVGAVALDLFGNLAAGTSTGGRTNKPIGRIGDSAIIGAGTYACNGNCAISCTGEGEVFIRAVAAAYLSQQVAQGVPLQQASDDLINNKMAQLKGRGGVIAVDANGTVAFSFNTPLMFRGYISADGQCETFIY